MDLGLIGAHALLGLVQGLTEFLPVSSSGHLIIAREVFGMNTQNGLAVDAVLQLATILAVLVYFRRDILQLAQTAFAFVMRKPVEAKDKTLFFALILGTIPAVLGGLFLEKTMDTAFRSAALVAWVLIAGSGLFLIAEYIASKRIEKRPLTLLSGIVIGLFQTLALIPGVSRSGSTISGGLMLGLSREEAARFGFLLSVPIILGSGGKKLLELGSSGLLEAQWIPILVAAVVAFAVGMLVIHYLMRYLKNHSLMVFAVYRVLLAIAVVVFLVH